MSPPFVERRIAAPDRPARKPVNRLSLGFFVVAALAVMYLQVAGPSLARAPFAAFLGNDALPFVRASATAFGSSGEVKVRLAMPGENLEYPLEVQGDPSRLSYAWVRVGDTALVGAPVAVAGAEVRAPTSAGFYQLAVVCGPSRRVLEELTVAVLVPFQAQIAGAVNGYRIGTYLAERISGVRVPEGFLEITPAVLDLNVTKHLRVRDFVNQDRQTQWPRYAAVSPRLLDKVELVVAELARWHGEDSLAVRMRVTSGFRSPEHNRRIRRAAADSRHQYGEAVDLVIDADGDGRITRADMRLVGLAVEIVEMHHPDLVGGLGLYLRGRPHVHIDVGGKRSRWRG
jgi:uncharacterized protein YcbK (DUF882 family)